MLTNRRILLVAVGLVAITTATFLSSQDATQKLQEHDKPFRLANTPPLAIDANADELTRLRIERRNAAMMSLSASTQLFLHGRGSLLDVVNTTAERALAAELDTPSADKLAVLQAHVEFARELENVVKERFSQGVTDSAQLAAAKCWRLETEVLLAREKLSK